MRVTYPDGEVVSYSYTQSGLLSGMSGTRAVAPTTLSAGRATTTAVSGCIAATETGRSRHWPTTPAQPTHSLAPVLRRTDPS